MQFEVKGLSELIGAFARFPDEVRTGMHAMGEAAGQLLRGELAQYPPRRYGVKNPPRTAKQRRFIHWAIRQGIIEIPYRRGISPGSEALGRSWTVETRTLGGASVETMVTVGTRASYAPLVQGDDQTTMHQGTGWPTDKRVAERKLPDIVRLAEDMVGRILARLGLR
ncbi:MAG: hypothetical protein KKA73_09525 [Chloroflexi bacterium]|nr:hypothetical protein [Chloroflexota bacterium]